MLRVPTSALAVLSLLPLAAPLQNGSARTVGPVVGPAAVGGAIDPAARPGGGAVPGGVGAAPTVGIDFAGPEVFHSPGASFTPPSPGAAVGPLHYVVIVTGNITIYDKSTGQPVSSQHSNGFWGVSGLGYSRVVWDEHHDRWVAISTDFDTRIHLAYSASSNPLGAWFQTSFVASAGTDAGRSPDYPTLGVDQAGVYVGASMLGPTSGATLWAIDKGPLLGGALGAITAFRDLPLEGAIQPCVTSGTPAGEYCVSRAGPTSIRVRRIDPPLSAPTLTELGLVTTPSGTAPPDAPASGSFTPIDTVGPWLTCATYRDGSIWTSNCVDSGGRAACRWYELDPVALTTAQVGTVEDPSLHYNTPSIGVNASGDAVLGFNGSDPTELVGCYYATRSASDPAGTMSAPVLYKAGLGTYTVLDQFGTNLWGAYSVTCVDPSDDDAIFTIQEYAYANGRWGTWVQVLEFGGGNPGCATPPSTYCVTTPNSVGSGALIDWTGTGSLGANDLTLLVTGCPSLKSGVFFYGPNAIPPVPFGGGMRCVGGGLSRAAPLLLTEIDGTVTRILDLTGQPFSSAPNQVLPGLSFYFQFWYRDSGSTNLTNALEVPFCP